MTEALPSADCKLPSCSTVGGHTRCLVCHCALDTSDLAACCDVCAVCPASEQVTYLEKVRSTVAPTDWPGEKADGDLVCPRCSSLVNDIVIYENRLTDLMQKLGRLVNATLTSGIDASAFRSQSGKLRPRKRRKLLPHAIQSSATSVETPHNLATSSVSSRVTRTFKPKLYSTSMVSGADPIADHASRSLTYSFDQLSASESGADDLKVMKNEATEMHWEVSAEPMHPRPTRPFTCPVCQKQLSSDRSLKRHLALHSDQRRFACATCGKAFMDSRALRRHQVDHTGIRPFCCSLCGKTLLSSHALKVHQRNHLGIKTDQCQVCYKLMSSAQTLKEHMRIHTGERPYSCEHCGRTFRTEKIMSSHLRTHTGSRPYVCAVCGRGFSQRTPLTAHLRTAHTAEEREACYQEKIGRTAIKTAGGIVEIGNGRLVAAASGKSDTDVNKVQLNIPVVSQCVGADQIDSDDKQSESLLISQDTMNVVIVSSESIRDSSLPDLD